MKDPKPKKAPVKKSTARNPRNAGRKKTRVDGKICNVYLSGATLAALEPLVKSTGSLGAAITAVVEAQETPPADIARQRAALETLAKIRALVAE